MKNSLLILLMILSSCVNNTNKQRIGVFGGSQSLSSYSTSVKQKWEELFDAKVFSCGKVGAGFNLKSDNNILSQVLTNPPFDVYILWCSTNDAYLDSTKDNILNPESQSGGLYKVYLAIQDKNPDAMILLFTSINVPRKDISKRLPILVEQQISFCEKMNIPYLNQFIPTVLSFSDFQSDSIHIASSTGYWKLEQRQTAFLISNLN